MIKAAESLFNYLNKVYENRNVYYLGDKVFVDVSDKKKSRVYDTISFFVQIHKSVLLERFLDAKEVNKNYIEVEWGLKKFKIYHNRIDLKRLHGDAKITLFSAFQNKYGILDTTYKPNNRNVSCINDIQNQIIRLVGNNYPGLLGAQPELILKIFEFKSINNYTIEPYTLIAMDNNKHRLKDFSLFYNIFKNPYVIEVLDFVNRIQFFKDTEFEKTFNKLYSYKYILEKGSKYKLSFMEQYFVIFQDNLYDNPIYKEYLSNYDKYCVKWCDKNYNLISKDKRTTRENIYKSIDNIILKNGIQVLKNCLIRLNNIRLLQGKGFKKDHIMYCLCGRPYFKEQLHITDEEIVNIFKTKDIENIKTQIIKFVLTLEHYPDNLVQTVRENKDIIINI